MVLATHAGSGVTGALRPELAAMVDDLQDRLASDPSTEAAWRAQHKAALTARRSAASWTDWCTDLLTQAAVGWVLGTVFVRFCEDNRLLGGHPGSRTHGVWITSNDRDRRQQAIDAERVFYQTHSDLSYREWLETAFDAFRREPATKELVGDHSAIHILSPSSDAVNRLLTFWRRTDDHGDLVWDFADTEQSTRFLGDLYQDLSQYAKDKYALLQTPEFVEEFILDQTMGPALKDRPLQGFRMIDPTCGSGHFLLGAFQRLLDHWDKEEPGTEPWALVQKSLDGVYGVDLNPFAVAIVRFRLIVAALQAAHEMSLLDAPGFVVHVAVGDSLLHGESQLIMTPEGDPELDVDLEAADFAYSTEDLALLRSILVPGAYDVVVGNPPYKEFRDSALKTRYSSACRLTGSHMPAVPFMQRFFGLAKSSPAPGWVGQITSNAFMKREFGKQLVEKFLCQKDLRIIADTAGAYIPGHGTPTVIIVGRNTLRGTSLVRTIVGVNGEPGRPDDAATGLVWTAIATNFDNPEYEDKWISVLDIQRSTIDAHPWRLYDRITLQALKRIDESAHYKLSAIASRIGFQGDSHADEVFFTPHHFAAAIDPLGAVSPMAIRGENVRNWISESIDSAILPYDESGLLLPVDKLPGGVRRELWSQRTVLWSRSAGKGTYLDVGRAYHSWHQLPRDLGTSPSSIGFAFVTTHNHFSLERDGRFFNRSAPIIKLSEMATTDDHLKLLGLLNSSTACFWLRKNSHDKGRPGAEAGGADEPWERRFEFTGTTLEDFPIPDSDVLERSRSIDQLGHELMVSEPANVIHVFGPDRGKIADAEFKSRSIVRRMIAEQEELDWAVYGLFGLVDEDLTYQQTANDCDDVTELHSPGLDPGERAFAVQLARQIRADQLSTSWFTHHNHQHTPITKVPDHWPADYQKLVQRRLDLIETDRFIGLLERPEYKRRWQSEPWSVRLTRALRDHLLDRLDDRWLWFTEQGMPQPRSVAQIADLVETAPQFGGFTDALDMWVGRKGAPTAHSLTTLLEPEGVPYLAALRYKDSGLRKREEWESVWEAQRAEDAETRDPKTDPIPVPPKYTGPDFVKESYWSHRGKLDVPKERFISYPGAGRLTDPSMLLGWARWNHAEQGLALGRIFTDRETESADPQVLTPLIAGVAEVLPWVKQWHSGIDPELGTDLGEYLDGQIDSWSDAVGVARDDLRAWRPPAPALGRRIRTAPAGRSASAATTGSTASRSPTDVQAAR